MYVIYHIPYGELFTHFVFDTCEDAEEFREENCPVDIDGEYSEYKIYKMVDES